MLNKEQGTEKYIVNHLSLSVKLKTLKKATIKQSGRVPRVESERRTIRHVLR
jgi:hypothetical protein